MLTFTRTQALEQRAGRYAHQMIDFAKRCSEAIRLSGGPVRAPLLSRSIQLSAGTPPFFRLQQFRADLGSRLAVNRRARGNGRAGLPEWGWRRMRVRAVDIDFRQEGSRRGRRVCIRMPARLRAAGSAAPTTGKDGHGRRQEQRRED